MSTDDQMTLMAFLSGLVLLAVRPVYADIFAFTDERGVVHYTNVPVDTRYQMILGTLAAPTPLHSHLDGALLHRTERYAPIIELAARASSIEPALVTAVLVAESGGDPHALSSRGAAGLMQLMPETARRYGVRNVFDAEENIRGGAQYLRDLSARYANDLERVLAAYNAGPTLVDEYGGKIPPLRETLDYVPRVLGIYQYLRGGNAAQHPGQQSHGSPYSSPARKPTVGREYRSARTNKGDYSR
jgi:soluble lytic murein transglycosylase-like protein